jgi:hypothetical protein
MKTGFRKKAVIIMIPLILALTNTDQAVCQTTVGILPVNVSEVVSSVLTRDQWQLLSLQLHEYLTGQMAGLGTVIKFTREHILLLLKEAPASDPDNLDADAYITICKKEKVQYLLKYSIESIVVNGKNVHAPLRIIVVDGKTGKVFWEDVVHTIRVLSEPEISRQILLNEVFKPAVNETSDELFNLNY